MTDNDRGAIGKIIKQRRQQADLSLHKLSVLSGVSLSHLGRMERGERFPSASTLRKIAKPLQLGEEKLFTYAGYLSPQPSGVLEEGVAQHTVEKLDPYVAMMLALEPIAVQRTLIGLLCILKEIAQAKR